jgi:hypothetical protein
VDRSPGPTSVVAPARDARAAAPCPRAACPGGEEARCDEDGLGPPRGLVPAAGLSAFWAGVILLARAIW